MAKASTPTTTPTPTPTAAAVTTIVPAGKFNFSQGQLRARFHEITAEKAAIVGKAGPLQTQYDNLRKQEDDIRLKIQPISDALNDIKAPLFALSNEQGMIARALGGITGEDPTVMAALAKDQEKP